LVVCFWFCLFVCFLVFCRVSLMSVTVHRTMYRSSTSLLLRPLQQWSLRDHALKHVERPRGSHEGVGKMKEVKEVVVISCNRRRIATCVWNSCQQGSGSQGSGMDGQTPEVNTPAAATATSKCVTYRDVRARQTWMQLVKGIRCRDVNKETCQ